MTMHIPEFSARMSIPAFPGSEADALRQAVERAAADHMVSRKRIMSRMRDIKPVSDARQDVYLALRELGWSLPRIGKAMGRDHTTVIHGIAMAIARRAEA